jgi:hypothetical protein
MLPQMRIDDVEAASCLNVDTAIICPNNLRLIIICWLSVKKSHIKILQIFDPN